MKLSRSSAVLLTLVMTTLAIAADKKAAPATVVDSGSFGVFVNGKRIATETFRIEQTGETSVLRSEVRADEAGALQNAELVMSSNGDLRRYQWNETSPAKAQAVVEPQAQFLMQRITGGPSDKPIEQPYILPVSTVILDDYFFSQREILAWRYLGANCRPDPGAAGCKLPRAQYGALIPRQRTSMLVNMEYVGREAVNIRGQRRELSRFNLLSDGMAWALWLDDSYKLVRVYIAADATEVLRD